MEIAFRVSGVFHPSASDEDNARVLQGFMEALIEANAVYLRRHPNTPWILNSGLRYARTETWDSIPDLLARRVGDCKSLTAMHVAQLRLGGRKARPVFRFSFTPRGSKDFHILTLTEGKYIDTSRILGMVEYHAARGLWMNTG